MSNPDSREEALSRLGGRSKIEQLTEALETLTSQFNQLRDEHQETVGKLEDARRHIKANALSPGTRVTMYDNYELQWYSEIGNQERPNGMVTIEGIGLDWCVIRRDSLPEVLFAAHPEIREKLADCIYL